MTVREAPIEAGEKIPAFYLHDETLDFGWIRWEIFTPRSRRKLFASEYRRPDNDEWAVQLNLSSPEKVWANPEREGASRRRHRRRRCIRERVRRSRRFPIDFRSARSSATARSSRTRRRARPSSIDPGDEPERILRALAGGQAEAGRAAPHARALRPHRRLAPRQGGDGRGDPPACRRPAALRRARRSRRRSSGSRRSPPLHPDAPLTDGETIRFGSHSLTAIHTPGHTPGSTCFRLEGDRPASLLRRHALPALDRPDGSLGRGHGRRSSPRFARGSSLFPATRPSSAATARTRRSRRRSA